MQKKKILIVDDEPSIREIFRALIDEEIEVFQAYNGVDGIKAIESQTFDIIITDLHMPELGGIHLIACTRVSKTNQRTPIFVYSGFVDSELERLANMRIIKIFRKGEDLNTIKKEINNALRDHQRIKPKSIGYHPEIVGLVQAGAEEIFSFYFEPSQIKIGSPYISTGQHKTIGQVTATGCLFGEKVYGCISMGCDKAMLGYFLDALFGDPSVTTDNYPVADLAGEMVNQLLGNLKFKFADRAQKVIIGVPQILSGVGNQLSYHIPGPPGCFVVRYKNAQAWVGFCFGDPAALDSENIENDLKIMIYENKRKSA